jgi:two-component system phosphate regulon sensor histidine kinase PhoR
LTGRIFFKLILAVLFVLAVAMIAVDYFASRVAERNYVATLTRELGDKCRMLAVAHGPNLAEWTPAKVAAIASASGARVTIIRRDGTVLFDSEADASHMENHANRPEVMAALRGEEGASSRQSPTTRQPYLYVATPVMVGALRLAVPLSEIRWHVNELRRQMLASTAIAFLPAILVAAFFARYFSRKLGAIIDYAGQLAEGNFRARLRNAGQDELGTLGTKLNETGEKLQRMFEELQREQVELEKLERIRKDFVINVSHELRTPLASIQGYTETLLDGALHDPDHNVRFLSIIRQNAERLGRLTADLLTLSRIELKTQRFRFASYAVRPMVDDCVDSMRPLADKKHIALSVGRDSEAEVFCDFEAVHQILSNLLDNAIKYTPEHGSIEIGFRALPRTEGRPELVEIFVQDTGIGIPEEELPRLFERFYRVDKARSRELGGTGLGLAIVKHLARAQGGDVGVTSRPGEGSRFWFTLPVQDLGLVEFGSVQTEVTAS